MRQRLIRIVLIITASLVLLPVQAAFSYPLDGFRRTGIERLEGYYYSVRTPSGARNVPIGSRLRFNSVLLSPVTLPETFPRLDPVFSGELARLVGKNRSAYSLAVVDLSDPDNPRYGAVNPDRRFVPGSVGKILVALAVYSELARIHPRSIEARERVLRDRMITANEWILTDSHDVPFWHREKGEIEFRPLEVGDTANLWSYLDFMMSSSSNAAASMLMRETLLMRAFGNQYPPSEAAEQEFFRTTSRARLATLLSRISTDCVERAGLSPRELRQGSLFTRTGKQKVAGSGSGTTVEGLARYLYRMEGGDLIDKFTSLEIKRLMYLTQARIRYSAAPILKKAAVYFKSGSLYSCRPERNFVCRKFHGNVKNIMNSAAVVEYPVLDYKIKYIVALYSNVLRKDSSQEHIRLAEDIHELLYATHVPPIEERRELRSVPLRLPLRQE